MERPPPIVNPDTQVVILPGQPIDPIIPDLVKDATQRQVLLDNVLSAFRTFEKGIILSTIRAVLAFYDINTEAV